MGTHIYKLKGFDPDNDSLTFGVINTVNSDILKIENAGNNEANVFLNRELDREVILKFLKNMLIK